MKKDASPDGEQNLGPMHCPYYTKGWCELYNARCSDIKNCSYKPGIKPVKKRKTDREIQTF